MSLQTIYEQKRRGRTLSVLHIPDPRDRYNLHDRLQHIAAYGKNDDNVQASRNSYSFFLKCIVDLACVSSRMHTCTLTNVMLLSICREFSGCGASGCDLWCWGRSPLGVALAGNPISRISPLRGLCRRVHPAGGCAGGWVKEWVFGWVDGRVVGCVVEWMVERVGGWVCSG